MKYKLTILIFMCAFLSCSEESGKTNEFPQWLIGKWQMKAGEGKISEIWEVESDSTLNGISWYHAGEDSLVTEKLKLLKRAGDLYYIADVPENNTPVYFKAVVIDENKYVFENPEHDFPKRIIYNIPRNDTLHVRIEGDKKGKDFIFVRK